MIEIGLQEAGKLNVDPFSSVVIAESRLHISAGDRERAAQRMMVLGAATQETREGLVMPPMTTITSTLDNHHVTGSEYDPLLMFRVHQILQSTFSMLPPGTRKLQR